MKYTKFFEYLKLQDNEIKIDYVKDSDDLISLVMGKNKDKAPYRTSGVVTYNKNVYSSYLIKNASKTITNVLKGLKGKGDYTVSPEDLQQFVNRTAQHLWHTTINKLKIDTIVTISSSSPLAKQFAAEFEKRVPNVIYLPDTLFKGSIENVEIGEKASDDQIKALRKTIDKFRQSGTEFELKKVRASWRKLITGFMAFDEQYAGKIKGKRVLVIDDYFTTGATFRDSFRILDILGAEELTGATIFKYE